MNNQDNIHVLSRAVIVDQEHILLCKTKDLKINFYYLPGGHIEHSESVEKALVREIMEEIGVVGKIDRFLGCLEHSFPPGGNCLCHDHEYNFIFKLSGPELTYGNNLTSPEPHIELVWKPLSEVANIDFRAEPLKKLLPVWLSNDKNSMFASKMLEVTK